MNLTSDDIVKIIRAARDANLVRLRYSGLSLVLGENQALIRKVEDNPARRREDLDQLARLAKINQAEEMKLLDPVGYEELVEQSLVGERPSMPEMDEPLPEDAV